MSYLRVESG